MISSLIEQIKTKHSFSQQDLADVMGISLDRIKSLSTGRVKKFKPEETQALVDRLGIDANWLLTGTGKMFANTDSNELSVDEEMLLSAYRELTVSERKMVLKEILPRSLLSSQADIKTPSDKTNITNNQEQKVQGIHNSPNSQISNRFNQGGYSTMKAVCLMVVCACAYWLCISVGDLLFHGGNHDLSLVFIFGSLVFLFGVVYFFIALCSEGNSYAKIPSSIGGCRPNSTHACHGKTSKL